METDLLIYATAYSTSDCGVGKDTHTLAYATACIVRTGDDGNVDRPLIGSVNFWKAAMSALDEAAQKELLLHEVVSRTHTHTLPRISDPKWDE